MPGAGDALAWDRYAYVNYNPLKFIDPSGHAFTPPNRNLAMTDGGSNHYYSSGPYIPSVSTSEVAEEKSNKYNGEFGVSFNLDRQPNYVVDMYSDYPNDPNTGLDPFAVIDFVLRFQTLSPAQKKNDETLLWFAYTISDTQFTIENIWAFTFFDNAGTPIFKQIEFISGLHSPYIYNCPTQLDSYIGTSILSEPLSFPATSNLYMTITFSCRSCYDGGHGPISLDTTRYWLILMGNQDVHLPYDMNTEFFVPVQ